MVTRLTGTVTQSKRSWTCHSELADNISRILVLKEILNLGDPILIGITRMRVAPVSAPKHIQLYISLYKPPLRYKHWKRQVSDSAGSLVPRSTAIGWVPRLRPGGGPLRFGRAQST